MQAGSVTLDPSATIAHDSVPAAQSEADAESGRKPAHTDLRQRPER
jgi:hypothetical protein